MADKKISQLTGASTPLAGTEVLPIVQSGSTVKVSVDNLTKGRTVNATTFDTDVAAAGVTLSGTTLAADGTDTNIGITVTAKGNGGLRNNNCVSVGGATPSTSGAGYTFPATQSPSSDANTLDDYEEGNWTPTAIGTTTAGTGTYSTQNGRYTKVGRLVSLQADLSWSAHTGTGNIVVGPLPFVNNNTVLCIGSVYASNMDFGTSATQLAAFIIQSDTNIVFRGMINNTTRADVPLDASVDNLNVNVLYFVD